MIKISLYPLLVRANTIEDAWYKCLYLLTAEKGEPTILDPNGELGWQSYAREYKVSLGSFENQEIRREFDDITIHIKNPGASRRDLNTSQGLLPSIPEALKEMVDPPADAEYVDNVYLPYLLTGMKESSEDYTYGERINSPIVRIKSNSLNIKCNDYDVKSSEDGDQYKLVTSSSTNLSLTENNNNLTRVFEIESDVSQVERVIEIYRSGNFNTNQATMEIGSPLDIELRDPPCLRIIDTRVDDENKLHFRLYFRSWDLWGGFPANLAGLQMMKEYMVYRINEGNDVKVKDGEIVVSSKGLHLYGYQFDWAKTVTYRT
ncbi:hypothetical protein D6777_03155 [Candidatus Woesearchaeota archaeon]|nr:MAG: hypothetical protein D6777_03155 [Candidatus Woesearchaeota archaeon]